ncbi:MAG: glycosyltransferase family 2 protein [Fibrobacter sp.]|jgi:glycosyltransferase involved in cell wall biosynthesis|nr:glycosyltransferase family 2 protein [Fibrobacter sp.]
MTKKISIFIPAYNAAAHIKNVINRFPARLWESIHQIYIINDGSTDSTKEVVEKLCDDHHKIHPVHFCKNQGYGTVVKTGLDLCRKDSCDFAVCLHADEQYPPEYIIQMVDEMEKEEVDLMQGSRIGSGTALSGGMPLYKYIAGMCLVKLENFIFRMQLTDYHSGFLIYNRRSLNTISFDKLSRSFDFDLEVIASARACKLKIAEYPIPTRYAGEISYLNPVVYGLRVLKVLFKFLCGAYRC